MPGQAMHLALEPCNHSGDLLQFVQRRMGPVQRALSQAAGWGAAQVSRLKLSQWAHGPARLPARQARALESTPDNPSSAPLLELALQVRQAVSAGSPPGSPAGTTAGPQPGERLALRVQLLGGFSVFYGDQPVTWIHAARLQSLLAYLLLNSNSPQSRQQIAFRLWPDTSEASARNNLRQSLHQLRHLLPDPERFLITDANTAWWHLDEGQSIDALLFAQALKAAEQARDSSAARQRLKEALSLYQGDLLPGCYDEWISAPRERMRQRCVTAYQKLVQLLEQQREYGAALQAAQFLLRLDPLEENTTVTLMRLHDLSSDRPAARRVYQAAVKTLREELGSEPGEALRAAYQRIQRDPAPVTAALAAPTLSLVGRQTEWGQLQQAWQQAASGNACCLLIQGEAGIGKSRLAEELFHWAVRQGYSAAHARSYAAEGRLSLAPVTEWLHSPALRAPLRKLDKTWLTEVSRLLPELLSEQASLPRPEPINEYGRRQRFFEALARAVLAAPRPILLWIDDLQWSDPETLEWLHYLLRFEPHSPLLVLGTLRSEESPPGHPLAGFTRQLRAEDKLTSIELSPLDLAETTRLANQIGGHELEPATTRRLYQETEGNPLFVVETLRAGPGNLQDDEHRAASGADPLAHPLPPRVYAVVAGRLAQLSTGARKVAELGAAVGREFTLEVLLQVEPDDEQGITEALEELWQKRILRERSPNAFDFTHDKLREVMYAETNLPQRRLLHRRLAQALERLHGGELDPVSTQIAAHYEQAGLFAQALPYYQRAASVAASVYANEDAIALLRRAILLLPHLAPGDPRDRLELTLLLALAPHYRIAIGWTSPEVESTVQRALLLSEKTGEVSQRIQALFGMQTVYVVQAKHAKVLATYAQVEELFRQAYHASPPPSAAISYAGAKLQMGELAASAEQFEKIVALHETAHVLDLQEWQGLNYLVHGNAWYAHALWLLGYPQKALRSGEAAVQYAHEYAQPFNQALAVTYQALLRELCAGPESFAAQAEEALRLTQEYKAPYYHAWAAVLACFSRAQVQPGAEGLARLQEAIETFTASGARVRMPYFLSLLGRAWAAAGRPDEGLAALELGLAEAGENHEHWWDAELHRLRGELLRSQGGGLEQAEAEFGRALEIAQAQQARSLELRAATSLARLLQAGGRAGEGKDLLQRRYAWFAEGLDTPDLQAAKTLLDELSKLVPE